MGLKAEQRGRAGQNAGQEYQFWVDRGTNMSAWAVKANFRRLSAGTRAKVTIVLFFETGQMLKNKIAHISYKFQYKLFIFTDNMYLPKTEYPWNFEVQIIKDMEVIELLRSQK